MKKQFRKQASSLSVTRPVTVLSQSQLMYNNSSNYYDGESVMGSVKDYGSVRTFKRIPKKPENLSVTAQAAKERQSKGPLRTKEYR